MFYFLNAFLLFLSAYGADAAKNHVTARRFKAVGFKQLFKRSVITRNRRAIDYSAADGADRMGMPADIRIKAVAFALDDDTSEKSFAVQGVEQPVNRCEAYVRKLGFHGVIHIICRRVVASALHIAHYCNTLRCVTLH